MTAERESEAECSAGSTSIRVLLPFSSLDDDTFCDKEDAASNNYNYGRQRRSTCRWAFRSHLLAAVHVGHKKQQKEHEHQRQDRNIWTKIRISSIMCAAALLLTVFAATRNDAVTVARKDKLGVFGGWRTEGMVRTFRRKLAWRTIETDADFASSVSSPRRQLQLSINPVASNSVHRRQAHGDNVFGGSTHAPTPTPNTTEVDEKAATGQNRIQIDTSKERRRWRRNMRKFERATKGRNYRYRYTQFDVSGKKIGAQKIVVRNNKAQLGRGSGRSSRVPTINDLLDDISNIVKTINAFSQFNVEYNRRWGYPTKIDIYHVVERGEDVSVNVRASKLKVLGQSGSRDPAKDQDCSTIPYGRHRALFDIFLKRRNKPTRSYKIFTPSQYQSTEPSAVVVMLHGWSLGGFCDGDRFLTPEWKDIANRHNYVLVAPDGIEEGTDFPKGWAVPGSRDGTGRNGRTVTSCDQNKRGAPDHCYPSCGGCGGNRCGWTQCKDDE